MTRAITRAITRNEAYLTVVEGWLRDNRSIVFTDGAVDDLCDRIAAEVEQLTGSKAALQTEIERLRGILDGTERREAEYLALIEKGHDEIERLKIVCRDQAGVELSEENDRLIAEIARLKTERHTTKQMLEDILHNHGVARPGRP